MLQLGQSHVVEGERVGTAVTSGQGVTASVGSCVGQLLVNSGGVSPFAGKNVTVNFASS